MNLTRDAVLRHFGRLLGRAALWHEPDILGVDVTMSQAKCLFVVALHPQVRMSALAAQLGVGPSTASGLVDRLVEHGYLARHEDQADRRQLLVSLTAAGCDVTERFRRFSRERLADLLVGLSPAELEALRRGLGALDREASRHDLSPGPAIERTPA